MKLKNVRQSASNCDKIAKHVISNMSEQQMKSALYYAMQYNMCTCEPYFLDMLSSLDESFLEQLEETL